MVLMNGIEALFVIFAILLLFSIVGYIAYIGLTYIPVAPGEPNTIAYTVNYTFNFIDNTLLWIFIIALFFDLLSSYFSPSLWKGILNLIGLFALGYMFLLFSQIAPSIFGPLGTNTILPITYSFFRSSYSILVIFFFSIFSIILNFFGGNKGSSRGRMR